MDSIDTIVLGRVTYEMFAGYWPNVTSGDEEVFARKLNSLPKIVFSKTLSRAPWGTWPDATLRRDDPASALGSLKQQSGKDLIVWGSISLAQALMPAGTIDEYQLVVCPVVLGDGRSLFTPTAKRDMTLLETKTFDRSAVLLKYR